MSPTNPSDTPPKWEPYLHTGFYLCIAIAVFAFFGFLAGHPFLLWVFFLITSSGAILTLKATASTKPTPLWWCVIGAVYFSFMAYDHYKLAEGFSFLALGYVALAAAWAITGLRTLANQIRQSDEESELS